jgi:hypothetical protein
MLGEVDMKEEVRGGGERYWVGVRGSGYGGSKGEMWEADGESNIRKVCG